MEHGASRSHRRGRELEGCSWKFEDGSPILPEILVVESWKSDLGSWKLEGRTLKLMMMGDVDQAAACLRGQDLGSPGWALACSGNSQRFSWRAVADTGLSTQLKTLVARVRVQPAWPSSSQGLGWWCAVADGGLRPELKTLVARASAGVL